MYTIPRAGGSRGIYGLTRGELLFKTNKVYTNNIMVEANPEFPWYLDLAPNLMFSLYDYPFVNKSGLLLCLLHGRQLERKEVVTLDK